MDTTTKHANVDADPSAFNLGTYKANSSSIGLAYNVEIQLLVGNREVSLFLQCHEKRGDSRPRRGRLGW